MHQLLPEESNEGKSMTTLTDKDQRILSTSVVRGAKWLDQRQPDWFRRVKLTSLQLSSESFCVLGQLGAYLTEGIADFGSFISFEDGCYYPEIKHLMLDDDIKAERYGFNIPEKMGDRYDSTGWKHGWTTLNEAWKAEIRSRRQAAKEAKP
jgi:hypothetical protein